MKNQTTTNQGTTNTNTATKLAELMELHRPEIEALENAFTTEAEAIKEQSNKHLAKVTALNEKLQVGVKTLSLAEVLKLSEKITAISKKISGLERKIYKLEEEKDTKVSEIVDSILSSI